MSRSKIERKELTFLLFTHNQNYFFCFQPTAEQMRLAQIIDTKTEDPDLKDKIKQVMDATRKTEDEVCTALHDCDNDLDRQ